MEPAMLKVYWHFCQFQVLGIPRAVFPSPGKDEDKVPIKVIVPSSKSDKKRKIVTVTTTASGKVIIPISLWKINSIHWFDGSLPLFW